MDPAISQLTEKMAEKSPIVEKIRTEFHKVIVGQDILFNRMLSAILSRGHILLEGVPGLAKTLSISTMAKILDMDFNRIQFTPDMLPADIRGTLIYNQNTGDFEIKKGPIFSNFVLADEINRAPAKVQSALLESMQEKTATIGDQTYQLPRPFFVMATQNPIEQEGTYPLPEAQTDRFFMKVFVDYPSRQEEKRILNRMTGLSYPQPQKVIDIKGIIELQDLMTQIYVDDKITDYVVNIVYATRNPEEFNLKKEHLRFGASPRASISFIQAARVEAFLDSRGYVIPEDIKAVAADILRHRIQLSFEAEAEKITPDVIVDNILNTVEIP